MAVIMDSATGGITLVETEGANTSLTRTGIITALVDGDIDILASALTQLDNAGYTANSKPSVTSNLQLKTRTIETMPSNLSNVRFTLEYVALAETETSYVFRGGTSLSQVETEKDLFGTQITTAHTFPDPYDNNPDYAGKTITQGGKVSVFQPELTISAVGIESMTYPERLAAEWSGYVNATTWRGVATAGKWLCSSVNYELHDYNNTPKQWKFTFEFQYNHKGWNPFVSFTDPGDGKPPDALVAGVGYKSVTSYPTKDFNTKFPSV